MPITQSAPTTKRALIVLSHAIERAFDGGAPGGGDDAPGLVVALFQHPEHFEVEASRYGDLADRGHTVVVGFVGTSDVVPAGVHAVAVAAGDSRARTWATVAVQGGFAVSLVAHDERDLAPGESSLEASRLFAARWTFDRATALADARDVLAGIGAALPPEVLAMADRCVETSSRVAVSRAESRLAAATDHLVSAIEADQRRLREARASLLQTRLLVEVDQLTGLHNRHYLERFLGTKDRRTDLLALLVDVDDLKAVNDAEGHEAGDALLRAVAGCLAEQHRRGDVLVRWGGDEFLLLLARPGDGDPLAIGQRLARAVRAMRLPSPFAHVLPSVSIGVTEMSRTPLPVAQLDAALFAVKHSGKGDAAFVPSAR